MRKLFCILLALLMLVTCAAAEEMTFTPGTYEGKGQGNNGPITVQVTVDDHAITAIEIGEHAETVGTSDPAFNKIPQAILDAQSNAVDTVAGATFSSAGILEAVKAALLAAGASEEAISREVAADTSEKEALEYSADVVVIGAGGAGMSAALEAVKAGASVIVIEETGSIGGNTIVAGSAMNGADPERQQKQNMTANELSVIEGLLAMEPHDEYVAKWQAEIAADIEAYKATGSTYLYDSPALHKLQTYKDGDYVANPELLDYYGSHALESIQFLTDLGVNWTETITAAIGATWTRSHTPTQDWGSAGASFVLPQAKLAQELGAEVKLEHIAQHLILEDGRVVGVTGVTTDGAPFTAHAAKGVIMCTGGFGANVEMRQKYNTHWANLDESVETTNVSTARGDGIVMAEEVGANLVGMEWIQMLPTGKIAFGPTINNTIFVNKNGERFVKEDGRRDELSRAILEQPGAYYYKIVDAHTSEDELHGITYKGLVIEEIIDNVYCAKGETVEELATILGMDPAVLQATIDDYNAGLESGNDRFGRAVFDQKIDRGPYYALHGVAKVHHTMGGIEINVNAQVLDTEGNVIPGFYAAGEVTGGIHGSNRLGGNAITDVVTFGRRAGQQVVK